jgi:phosphoribosylformylglycinamidine synthase
VRVTVLVRPKEGILDPQGEAVRHSLAGLGLPVADARVGRVIDLEVEVTDAAEAVRVASEAAERLLANGLIESFQVLAAEAAPA